MAYTVQQLAQLAGVSVRTLHHYDEIGLLRPTMIGANGYRYYDQRSVLRLQSILFYRELEFPLLDIKAVLDRPNFDPLVALQEQRKALEAKVGRLHGLIQTIDRTIKLIKGETAMETEQLFAGLTPEREKEYTEEAARRWGEDGVRRSQQRYSSYSSAMKQQISAEGNDIYRAFVAAIPHGPKSDEAQSLVPRWRTHLEYFWVPNDDQCVALSAGYRDDPAFRKTFDAIHPSLAEFMAEAVRHYVVRRKAEPQPSL